MLLGLRLDVWVEDVLHLQFCVSKANGIDVLFGEFYLHGRVVNAPRADHVAMLRAGGVGGFCFGLRYSFETS